jgi:glycosyltransferase involved in cell wall biosynthesis
MVDDVPRFWHSCDVAVVPSSSFVESFCLAAIEAAACGKPVIATRNGALPEVLLDGVTGMLVPPGDVDALARAVLAYARQPSLRAEHASAARAWAEKRFQLDQCAKAYLEVFAELERSR